MGLEKNIRYNQNHLALIWALCYFYFCEHVKERGRGCVVGKQRMGWAAWTAYTFKVFEFWTHTVTAELHMVALLCTCAGDRYVRHAAHLSVWGQSLRQWKIRVVVRLIYLTPINSRSSYFDTGPEERPLRPDQIEQEIPMFISMEWEEVKMRERERDSW